MFDSNLNKLVAGLYLTQLFFRTQIAEMAFTIPKIQDENNFRNAVLHGEAEGNDRDRAAQCFAAVHEVARNHIGFLQMTRLHADLFTPGVLSKLCSFVLEDTRVDWNDVGCLLEGAAKQFKVDVLINPLLERSVGQQSGEQVVQALQQGSRMFDNARTYDETFVKPSVFRYADLYSSMFHRPQELMRQFAEVGIKMGPDDSEDIHAVANIMGGDPDGSFEAFCIRHSLGLKVAQAWEEQMVGWGYREYKGAVAGLVADGRGEFKALMASATIMGYPVYIQDKHLSEFEDLLLKIPGATTDEERDMVENLINCIAPTLYFELCEHGERRSAKWRGIRLSSSYDGMVNELEHYEGSGWLPLVRIATMRFANRRFDRRSITDEYDEQSEKLVEKARLVASKSQATCRLTYLVQELLRVIEDDFYAQKFFCN